MIKNKIKKKILQELSYKTSKYFISPEIASLVITYKCNFKCRACTVWRMENFPELPQSDWEKICEQLKSVLLAETSIEISGGEPLLRKELLCFLIHDLKKFFKNVGINSNGLLLNEETAKALKTSGIDFVKISLYSLKNEVHDELRGVFGAAENAKKAIDLLKKQNIRTDIGVLVTSKNISSIPKLIEHYSLPEYSKTSIILQPLDEPIGLQPVTGKDKISTIEDLWPDKASVEELFFWLEKNETQKIKNSKTSLRAIKEYYLNQKSALNRRCFAGQRNLVIYPDGGISLCYKGSIIGNIAKENLSNILFEGKAIKERQNMKKCKKLCRIIGCNFSRTFSEIMGLK